jgi:ABC-2 type transport system ATP-binding protein
MSASAAAIEITGLAKKLGPHEVLESVDLVIPAGRVTVLLGRNGCGKTTMLRCLLGLMKPDAGAVRVSGLDPIRQRRALREQVGYVPDTPDVEPWMTPTQLLAFLQPHYPTWNPRAASELLERFGVPRHRSVRQLSRGQGMKAMLAAALAPDPPVMLLDEPFAGLDPLASKEVLRALLGEVAHRDRTVLCATHDLEVAARIADDVAVLARGRIVRYGALEEVLGSGEEAARAPERLGLALAGAVSDEGEER